MRGRIRRILSKLTLPMGALACGAAMCVAFAGVLWDVHTYSERLAFLYGLLAAGLLAVWATRPEVGPPDTATAEERERLALERQRVEMEYSRWSARRAKLECALMKRRLRDDDWRSR